MLILSEDVGNKIMSYLTFFAKRPLKKIPLFSTKEGKFAFRGQTNVSLQIFKKFEHGNPVYLTFCSPHMSNAFTKVVQKDSVCWFAINNVHENM